MPNAAFDKQAFNKALNPYISLDLSNELHRKFYVDLSATRVPGGTSACDRLWNNIAELAPSTKTVNLLTGRMGTGKSTELLRLKHRLEEGSAGASGFLVVYHDVSQDIDLLTDDALEIGEIVLSIAHAVVDQIEAKGCTVPALKTSGFLQDMLDALQTEISISDLSISAGFAKVTAKFKSSFEAKMDDRERLRVALARGLPRLGELINKEVIATARDFAQQQGRQGLVIIVDGLDRISSKEHRDARITVPEYIFVDKASHLRQFDCHVVYALPRILMFSTHYLDMCRNLGVTLTENLPMVAVHRRDTGADWKPGIEALGDVVLARAFPDDQKDARRWRIGELFDAPEQLDLLCRSSGGNVRLLFGMLNDCINDQTNPPFKAAVTDRAIRHARDNIRWQVGSEILPLLSEIKATKKLQGVHQASTLNFTALVYEYEDEEGGWFDVNPLIELPPI